MWWFVRRRDGILENALHPQDIDEIEAQGSLASGFHASMAVLVGQAHELLSLSELGPRNDAAEEQAHETADVGAEFLGLAHHTLSRTAAQHPGMIWSFLCSLISAFKTRREPALENLALRHQLAVVYRSVKRPRLSDVDRGFWVLLHRIWTDWERVLVIVKP